MEPVQIGRDDPRPERVEVAVVRAAMEPVQIGRDDVPLVLGALADAAAAMEPVQIGRDDLATDREAIELYWPQWSPSRSDGMTGRHVRDPAGTQGRNGARPDRTG